MKRITILSVCLTLLATVYAQADEFDHNHDAFTEVLKAHVENGRVDYAALKAEPKALKAYLKTLAAVEKQRFDSWKKNEQLAFLVNLYNAATLDLIVQHYPIQSIKRIGTLFKGPWKQPVVSLWGTTTTLDHVEHKIIRVEYPDVPEIHFALVCAAKGCPDLRSEAYRASDLDTQFAEQLQEFLSDRMKNKVDKRKKRVHISPIFKWFAEDFEGTAGSVQAYLRENGWPEVKDEFEVRYTHYSWSLNKQ